MEIRRIQYRTGHSGVGTVCANRVSGLGETVAGNMFCRRPRDVVAIISNDVFVSIRTNDADA